MNVPLFVLGILGVIISLAAVFYFSVSEAALLAVSDVTVRRRARRGDGRAQTVQRLHNTGDFIAAMNIGANAGALLIATLITVLVHEAVGEVSGAVENVVHIGAIAMILVLAEITPKSYGSTVPDRVAFTIAPSVEKLTTFIGPLIVVLSAFSKAIFGEEDAVSGRGRKITLGQLRAAAQVGREQGALEQEEGGMFNSLIELTDTEVEQIMIPRENMVSVRIGADIEQVMDLVIDSGFSRIPVYEHSIDQISGVLHANRVLDAHKQGLKHVRAGDVAEDLMYVTPDTSAVELFRRMRAQAMHMAIVTDEAGDTKGLITMEDILEELTGEIRDEYDRPPQEAGGTVGPQIEVTGDTTLREINRQLNADLPEDEYATVGELVTALAGRVPAAGKALTFRGVRFTVQQADTQDIRVVRVSAVTADNART